MKKNNIFLKLIKIAFLLPILVFFANSSFSLSIANSSSHKYYFKLYIPNQDIDFDSYCRSGITTPIVSGYLYPKSTKITASISFNPEGNTSVYHELQDKAICVGSTGELPPIRYDNNCEITINNAGKPVLGEGCTTCSNIECDE